MATLSDANFTGVRASLGDWLHRSDMSNTDLGNFIYLFEADFNTQMRVRGMEAQTSIGATSGYLQNPSDWLAWKSITLVSGTNRYPLQPLSEEAANVVYGLGGNSQPQGYIVRGNKTILVSVPDSAGYTYETVYYQGVPALNSTNTTNWLLTAYPQVYLQGSMFWAGDYLVDDQKQQKYDAMMNRTLDQIEKASKRASFRGGTLQMRPDRSY